MTADNPQPATTGKTRLRSTQRTTARTFVVTNKRKHKITNRMIAPTPQCQSLPAAKLDTITKSRSFVSRYSEWLRALRYEDRIQMWRDFPHPSRSTLRPTHPPTQWVSGLSWGYSGRGVVLTIQTV